MVEIVIYMSYKLLEISAFYTKYLEYFYQKNPNLDNLDYNNHLKFILSDCFAECDFIHPELHKLGVESKIVIYNDERLQRKWKDELKNSTLFEIVCEQIRDYKPDVLYINDMGIFDVPQLALLKQITKNKCKFVGWHFSVVSIYEKTLREFDQIYTGSKYIQNEMIKCGVNSKLLYHAFEKRIRDTIQEETRSNCLVFPGSIMIGKEIHNGRVKAINKKYLVIIMVNYMALFYLETSKL